MRFLVDHCAGRRLADWLRDEGHDVVEARGLGPDPGDRELLARAASEARVLVTLDKHFGRFVFLEKDEHAGLVRLPDVPAADRIELVKRIVDEHADDLADRRVVTVRGRRMRVSSPPRR